MKFGIYQKASSEIDLLKSNLDFKNKVVVDVGCGLGKITRLIANECSFIFGVDTKEIICKAVETEFQDNIMFIVGTGQDLSIIPNIADIVIFLASFHHIPEDEMEKAIEECYNVLKDNGIVCFYEPVGQPGSYYDLTRLVEDEMIIQKRAYEKIKKACKAKFSQINESFYYFERSFQDYLNLINIYVPESDQRLKIIKQAEEIVIKRNETIDNIRFESLGRMNLFAKNSN